MAESLQAEELKSREVAATPDRLQAALQTIAHWQVDHRPRGGRSFAVRLENARHSLRKIETTLAHSAEASKGIRAQLLNESLDLLRQPTYRRLLRTTISGLAGGLQKFNKL